MLFLPILLGNLEDDFKLDRHPQGKAGNADDQSSRCLLDAKNITKQIRYGVRDPGLVEEVPRGCHEYSKPHYASDSIERTQMLSGGSKDAQRRGVGGIPSCLGIKFLPQPAYMHRFVVHDREHPAEEEKAARL